MTGQGKTKAQRRREALQSFIREHRADMEELAELEERAKMLRAKIRRSIDRIGKERP